VNLSPVAHAIRRFSRGVFLARRALAPRAPSPPPSAPTPAGPRRRNILLVTVDQQRYDALGITGHPFARTPVVDALARGGSTTGGRTCRTSFACPRGDDAHRTAPAHAWGVSNWHPARRQSPNVARLLRASGYRTALLGKAHFDPHLDPLLRFPENRRAAERDDTPWRGFEHVEFARTARSAATTTRRGSTSSIRRMSPASAPC
jgi:arylsulfatase A-like enzyme